MRPCPAQALGPTAAHVLSMTKWEFVIGSVCFEIADVANSKRHQRLDEMINFTRTIQEIEMINFFPHYTGKQENYVINAGIYRQAYAE